MTNIQKNPEYIQCPLTEFQLNILSYNKKDTYLVPLTVSIPMKCSADDLADALDVMSDVHPILQMKISNHSEIPSLVCGKKPPVSIKSDISDDYVQDFLK